MPATRLCHPRCAPRNLRKFFANSGPRGSSSLGLQLSTGVHWPSSPSWARFLSIIYGGNALPNNTHTLSCCGARGWRTGSLGGEKFFNRSRAQNYAKSCSDLRGFPPPENNLLTRSIGSNWTANEASTCDRLVFLGARARRGQLSGVDSDPKYTWTCCES